MFLHWGCFLGGLKNNDNDNDNDLAGKYDYKIQTGEKCRCGTELTAADSGADYIHGGHAVKIVSFIRFVLLQIYPAFALIGRQLHYCCYASTLMQ